MSMARPRGKRASVTPAASVTRYKAWMPRSCRSNRTSRWGCLSCSGVVDTGTSSWCGSTGLVSQTQAGGRSVGKGSGGNGMTRGDRRRNARRERLRAMLPRDGAVVGIDLADEKQALAVIDHDVRVLARKTVRVKAFRLGPALDWAVEAARAEGFAA